MSTTLNSPTFKFPDPSLTSRLAGPIIVGAVLTMLVVPLSPMAISLMFALNISSGLVILASSIYVARASDLLSFPSILLGTTLMRLALNVATARAILLNGYTGPGAAGTVIESFGRFVVGGNYVVGMIIFGILIVINFVVVTKGSSRVAEVSARFTLDSLPGRQMAIDADVNAGALTAKQAEQKREEIRAEADFFGAMDGASKFVRGDVVAAMIILVVNLVGGLMVGTLQHGLPLSVAAKTYTLLTVGDGVAAQIPSLTISIAAGLIVTRVSTGQDISSQVVNQIANYPQAMLVAAGLLVAMGVIPGMAHIPFLAFGALLGFVGYRGVLRKRAQAAAESAPAPQTKTDDPKASQIDIASVQKIDPFGLQIGFALVPLLAPPGPGKPSLLSRLTAVRSQFSAKIGFIVPNIHIRDSDGVRPQEYQFTIRDGVVGRGEVIPNMMLAIETDDVIEKIKSGRRIKDPVFGNDALWIDESMVAQAETLGYTVVDAASVIAAHLEAILKKNASEMIGRRETDEIIGLLAKSHPKLVDDLRARYASGAIRNILSGLVHESIPVRDFERIAEAMLDAPEAITHDQDRLLGFVRTRLARQIVGPFLDKNRNLNVLVLDPDFDIVVKKSIDHAQAQGITVMIEPKMLNLLRSAARRGQIVARDKGCKPVLVMQGAYRMAVARALIEIMPVIALEEIPESQPVSIISVVAPEPVNA